MDSLLCMISGLMLSPSGKLVLQGLLVLQVAATDILDCCPVKHVEG